jgi:hypothetical protein
MSGINFNSYYYTKKSIYDSEYNNTGPEIDINDLLKVYFNNQVSGVRCRISRNIL